MPFQKYRKFMKISALNSFGGLTYLRKYGKQTVKLTILIQMDDFATKSDLSQRLKCDFVLQREGNVS